MSVPKVVYTQDRQPKTTSHEDKQHVNMMHLLGVKLVEFSGNNCLLEIWEGSNSTT